jgi:hypothetical protein
MGSLSKGPYRGVDKNIKMECRCPGFRLWLGHLKGVNLGKLVCLFLSLLPYKRKVTTASWLGEDSVRHSNAEWQWEGPFRRAGDVLQYSVTQWEQ